jgi:nucleoside phosphorylase
MVGIGGGVPPKVRLGDVVVSKSVGEFGGVVQRDFGEPKSRKKEPVLRFWIFF